MAQRHEFIWKNIYRWSLEFSKMNREHDLSRQFFQLFLCKIPKKFGFLHHERYKEQSQDLTFRTTQHYFFLIDQVAICGLLQQETLADVLTWHKCFRKCNCQGDACVKLLNVNGIIRMIGRHACINSQAIIFALNIASARVFCLGAPASWAP